MKKGIKNIFYGLLSQGMNIIIGFVLPSLIISSYGSETNGLLSSTNQILVYLGLFEAGVGNATIQALYEPVAYDNKKKINSILAATNSYYNRTGLIYLLALCIASVIYTFYVKTSYSALEVVLITIFTGLGLLFNFWGFGKYKVYLQAEGKNYVANNILTISFVIANIGKIVLVLNECSIVLVQLMQVIYYALQMIGINCYIKIKYKWITMKEEPNYKAISQKNSVLFHQLSSLVFSNTSIIILTFFCGLSVVSVYSMYNLVFSTVMNLLTTVVASIVYILGKLYFSERKKYDIYHDVFESIYMWIGCAIFATVYIIVIPFMKLYTRGFNDINYIDFLIPILFFIMQFLNIVRGAANNLINIAGHFEQTKGRAMIEMTINIIISLLLVSKLGIYSVLLGTIVALLYRTIDMLYYENHYILQRKAIKSFVKFFVNALLAFVIIVLNSKWNHFSPNDYLELCIYSIIVAIIVVIVYGMINLLLDFKKIIFVCKEIFTNSK